MGRSTARRAVRAALAALILIAAGCSQPDTETSSSRPSERRAAQPQPGQDALDFSLTTFEGVPVRLSDLKGKPLVLNFWASWSPRCLSRASALEKLYQKHGAQDLQVLGVGVDDEGKLRVRAQEIELSYPVGASAETGHGYGVTDLPHTFFISREGKIVASMPGECPEECLAPGVEMVLASEGSEEYNAARDRFDAARASFDAARASFDAREAYRRGNESLRQAQAIRDGGGDLGEEWHRLIGEAVESYERAVALNPDLWQALYDWGVALLWQAEAASEAEAERLRRLALEKTVAAHAMEPKSYAAYNAAQLHALLGEPEECRKWLETAREFDWLPPVEHMQSDPDLDSVRDAEWFQEYLQR